MYGLTGPKRKQHTFYILHQFINKSIQYNMYTIILSCSIGYIRIAYFLATPTSMSFIRYMNGKEYGGGTTFTHFLQKRDCSILVVQVMKKLKGHNRPSPHHPEGMAKKQRTLKNNCTYICRPASYLHHSRHIGSVLELKASKIQPQLLKLPK